MRSAQRMACNVSHLYYIMCTGLYIFVRIIMLQVNWCARPTVRPARVTVVKITRNSVLITINQLRNINPPETESLDWKRPFFFLCTQIVRIYRHFRFLAYIEWCDKDFKNRFEFVVKSSTVENATFPCFRFCTPNFRKWKFRAKNLQFLMKKVPIVLQRMDFMANSNPFLDFFKYRDIIRSIDTTLGMENV